MDNVTVYGGGVIGSGWTIAFMMGGKKVTVYDINEECLSSTKRRIEAWACRLYEIDPAAFDRELIEKRLGQIKYVCDVEDAVKDANFIQECGPEKIDIKRAMIGSIEKFNSKAVIASSTSSLTVTAIAEGALHPERIVAGHPFNPVHLMPLVEVCGGEKTSEESLCAAKTMYSEIGKVPIVLKKECPGFVVNRIQNALNREVQDLVLREVVSVEDIDNAVTFGMGIRLGLIGPHMVFELAGGDGGIDEYVAKYKPSKASLGDLAGWTERPAEYDSIAVEGTKEELRRRPDEKGNTHGTLERFRDKGLIELLAFHGLIKK